MSTEPDFFSSYRGGGGASFSATASRPPFQPTTTPVPPTLTPQEPVKMENEEEKEGIRRGGANCSLTG